MNEPNHVAIGLAVAQDPILTLAMQYLRDHGFDLPKDGSAARRWCEAQAKLGIADAQVTCALLQSIGLFGEEDVDSARFWFRSAADNGHPAGILMLAGLVEEGSETEAPDAQRAAALARSAAEKGFGPALVQMGVMHLHGINVEENRELALEYLRKGANSGDRRGQFLLGAKLLRESNTESIEEGIRWLKLAASNGYAGAHRILGCLYSSGDEGVGRDEEKSEYHFSIAHQIEESARADFA
jgi:hypothetical protein